MTPKPAAPPPAAPPPTDGLPPDRRAAAVVTIGLAVALATLDSAIANTALPTIGADLGASPAASIWVITAYQLALVMTLLPLAALGEIIGYRRVFAIGIVVFTAASLVCALAWSLPSLAVARAVQGLGAAFIMSVNTALIRISYPAAQLGRGVGINALVVAVCFAVGPTVASGILALGPWPWLFAVNVPLGLLALALVRALPDSVRGPQRFDGPSAALNAATFGLAILAIGEVGHGGTWGEFAMEAAGAVGFGALLLRRQAMRPAPMLPVDLFARPAFALSALTSFGAFAAQGLAFVALPFYFQSVLGRSVVQTGVLMTPWPVVVGVMAPIAGRLSDHYPPGLLGGFGLAALALGLVSLMLLPADPGGVDIGWRMMLCGAGFGFFQAPNLRALLTAAPPERSGGASGIVATSRLLGQGTGAALVAVCFGLAGPSGPVSGATLALGVGAAFAAAASVASVLRLLPRRPGGHPGEQRGRA